MQIIIRKTFADLALGANAVVDWLNAWLAWRIIYLRKHPKLASRAPGVCRVVWTVGGYPSAATASVLGEWKICTDAQSMEGIELGKHDVIEGRSKTQTAKDAQLSQIVKPLFSGLAEGMAVMIELVTWDGGDVTPQTAQESLVIYGQMVNGQLIVKSIWPKALPHDDGGSYWAAEWPDEEETLKALQKVIRLKASFEEKKSADGTLTFIARDEFKAVAIYSALRTLTGEQAQMGKDESIRAKVSPLHMAAAITYAELDDSTLSIFSPATSRASGVFVKTLFRTTSTTEKFRYFFLRAAFWLAVTIGLVWLALRFTGAAKWITALAAGLPAIVFAIVVGWKGFFIWLYRREMRKGLQKIYTNPWEATEVTEPGAAFVDQPTFKKYSADIEALGGRHIMDLDVKNTGCSNLARLYFIPASKTYFYLSFMSENPDAGKNFPVMPSFLVRTMYEGGVNFASADKGVSFKPRLDKRSGSKVLVEPKSAADMLERHLRALKDFKTSAAGPVEFTKEDFIAREKSDHEHLSKLHEDYGYYSWWNAVGDSFGWIHGHYKEKR